MDNVIFAVIAISLIVILPTFILLNKYKGKTQANDKTDVNHRKHKHKKHKKKH